MSGDSMGVTDGEGPWRCLGDVIGPGEGEVYPVSTSPGRERRGEFRYALYGSGPGDWLARGRWGRDILLYAVRVSKSAKGCGIPITATRALALDGSASWGTPPGDESGAEGAAWLDMEKETLGDGLFTQVLCKVEIEDDDAATRVWKDRGEIKAGATYMYFEI